MLREAILADIIPILYNDIVASTPFAFNDFHNSI